MSVRVVVTYEGLTLRSEKRIRVLVEDANKRENAASALTYYHWARGVYLLWRELAETLTNDSAALECDGERLFRLSSLPSPLMPGARLPDSRGARKQAFDWSTVNIQ
ncbi:hypothetical protein [Massilia glaciei]|uniref:hypothetical protein n=1 Tax=Massilia glaciei TaxID=1524097 RepID=UPI0015E81B4C|nr:hypothetical protein [Massilia glaciei]